MQQIYTLLDVISDEASLELYSPSPCNNLALFFKES